MAGTVTMAEVRYTAIKKITWSWTSTSGGAADGATTYAYDGDLIGLTTDPDGTSAPTDNYDITITDSDGRDVLLGAGANRDTATTEHVVGTNLAAVAGSKLTLNVANAGDTKKGVVVLWLR